MYGAFFNLGKGKESNTNDFVINNLLPAESFSLEREKFKTRGCKKKVNHGI